MTHRVAIVGAGMIAHRHVSRWNEAGAEVVAVADIVPDMLAAFAQTHGIVSAYDDYLALLQREREIDIVDVCTPPWLHAPVTFAALEAGKHVLVEKPFALTATEADAMAEAADAAGRMLACRQGETRLSRGARTVRAVAESGVLGEIYFMRLIARDLYRPGIEYNPGAAWFLDRSRAGGGALYDWGVYDLELLWGTVGPLEVERVTAATFRGVDIPQLDTPFDVEEHAMAMLTLHGGACIFWERAWATHLPAEKRWDFYGTGAGFSFTPHHDVLRVDLNPRLTRYAPRKAIELPTPMLAPPGPTVYEDFLLAVEGKRAPACPAREAADMLRIIEAIYAASVRRD